MCTFNIFAVKFLTSHFVCIYIFTAVIVSTCARNPLGVSCCGPQLSFSGCWGLVPGWRIPNRHKWRHHHTHSDDTQPCAVEHDIANLPANVSPWFWDGWLSNEFHELSIVEVDFWWSVYWVSISCSHSDLVLVSELERFGITEGV